MKSELLAIVGKLKRKGIHVDSKGFKLHKSQGLMSKVYIVRSNKGELVVHLINPIPEWIRQHIHKKIYGIGKLLLKYPNIPTAQIFLSGRVGKSYFLVQEKLPGTPAGSRSISRTQVIDRWVTNRSKTSIKLQRIIAQSHTIRSHGYGWPVIKNGKLIGKYKSWNEFFEKEIPLWLRSIHKADKHSHTKASKYAQNFLKQVPPTKPFLVHGDAINPSNILTQGDRITGIIDWEWSIIGDPAWELCDPGWWKLLNRKSLQPYFKELKKTQDVNEDEIIRRAKLYRPIWLMWACHLHSSSPKGSLYKALRAILDKQL